MLGGLPTDRHNVTGNAPINFVVKKSPKIDKKLGPMILKSLIFFHEGFAVTWMTHHHKWSIDVFQAVSSREYEGNSLHHSSHSSHLEDLTKILARRRREKIEFWGPQNDDCQI